MDNKDRSLFYHNDGSFLLYCDPPLSVDDFVLETVGRVAGTQVTDVVCHMFGFGDAVPHWPTEVPGAQTGEVDRFAYVSEWRQREIMRQLWATGVDPWQAAIDAAHEYGMQYWGAMRFNDLHGAGFHQTSQFKKEHPEYQLGRDCPSGFHHPGWPDPLGEDCPGLNFAIEAVRKQRLALVEELCTRYDVDGFEWDFTRHPGHFLPDIEEGRAILTELLKEVRDSLDRIGSERGRRIGFGIRVPGTLQKCRAIGLDMETWLDEDLFDYISPGAYWDTYTDLPFDEFVEIAKESNSKILACPSEQVGPGHHPVPPRAALRAGASNAWAQGVDGIYVFNFHHQRIENIDDMSVLAELGHPSTLAMRDKLYMIADRHETVKNGRVHPGILEASPHQVPVYLNERDSVANLDLLVSEDLGLAERRGVLDRLTLRIAVLSVTAADSIEYMINGETLGAPALDLIPYSVFGAAMGQNAYQGNYLATFGLLGTGLLRQGSNEVSIRLQRRNPAIDKDLVVHDLTLDVGFRALPMRI